LPACCDSGRMAREDGSERFALFCGMPSAEQKVCRRANCLARTFVRALGRVRQQLPAATQPRRRQRQLLARRMAFALPSFTALAPPVLHAAKRPELLGSSCGRHAHAAPA
jgi:hypothetical protein